MCQGGWWYIPGQSVNGSSPTVTGEVTRKKRKKSREPQLWLRECCWIWGRCSRAGRSLWGQGRTRCSCNSWRSVSDRESLVHCCPPAWSLHRASSPTKHLQQANPTQNLRNMDQDPSMAKMPLKSLNFTYMTWLVFTGVHQRCNKTKESRQVREMIPINSL